MAETSLLTLRAHSSSLLHHVNSQSPPTVFVKVAASCLAVVAWFLVSVGCWREEAQEDAIKEAAALYSHSTSSAGRPERNLKDFILNCFKATMETGKTSGAAADQLTDRDLSEQIKKATKESHVRAENTQLMLSFQRAQVTLAQYKLLLCSLHDIYQALEEELDRNANHPGVAPIYFPAELARLEAIEKDLEYFYGRDWREKVVVPAATKRYCHRLRQIGRENPEFLVAHAYTRYLGDLSGGQILGRIAQRSMGLKSNEGLSFFAFPGVSSPNLFKQLYRSRMNNLELTEEQRSGVLEEAVRSFELNIQVFDDLQKMLNLTENQNTHSTHSTHSEPAKSLQLPGSAINASPLLRMVLGVFVALATVSMGIYVF